METINDVLYNGRTYTIDDTIPEEGQVFYRYKGMVCGHNAYLNHGQTLREYLAERKIKISDISEWWID